MINPITIVGAGQVGGLLSYKLLTSGFKIRVIDAGSKLIRDNRQVPWGWLRKFSLQSELKKSLMTNEFPLSDINIDQNKGPMLITSKNNESVYQWKDWITKNNNTDSKVFTPKEANNIFGLNEEYFNNQGGVYMCDSRDYLINFSKFNEYIWDYLKSHKNCELIDICHVYDIKKNNNTATHIITNQGDIEVSKLVLSIGNQSLNKFERNIPKLNITLPYTFIESIDTKPFISIWNKDSSLSYFGNGDIKLACGTQSIFNPRQLNLIKALHFSKMGLAGLSNLNLGKTNLDLIKSAEKELKLLGINNKIVYTDVKSCDIDLTPNLCPYIYFVPGATNVLNVTGFSGAGSMILDNNFIHLLIDSIINDKLNKKLLEFQPSKNILKNINTPDNKKTPLSSIV